MRERIGFVGLGIMGHPMCLNLLKAGFPLTIYNRTKQRMEPVLLAGAAAADTPCKVAENSDIVITMVTDTADVEQVIFGENGIIHGLKPGRVVIDMSTISPSATRRMAEKIKAQGSDMLDAPVSGGDVGAKAGTLAVMVGGDELVLERCRTTLAAMGKTITHVGGNGMGQTVKLCNQILVSVTNLAVCEAVRFAQQAGVDPLVMIEAVKNGAAGSWQLSNLGPRMVAEDYAPGFMIDLQQKDLRLALQAAFEMHLPSPALSLVHQLFSACQGRGEGRQGTQALIKSLQALTRVEAEKK